MAAKGTVLLKNAGVLPLAPARLKRVAVLGPFAHVPTYILGCAGGERGDVVLSCCSTLGRGQPVLRGSAHAARLADSCAPAVRLQAYHSPLPPPPPCSKYFGSTAGPVTTPLMAVRAALPGVEVTFNQSTSEFFTTENANADIAACQVRLGWVGEGGAAGSGAGERCRESGWEAVAGRRRAVQRRKRQEWRRWRVPCT